LCELRRIHLSFVDAVQEAHDIGVRQRQAWEDLLEEGATDQDRANEGSHNSEREIPDPGHGTLLHGEASLSQS
jgi:hypothetical protein